MEIEIEEEIKNFIKVWILAIASASYAYCLSFLFSKGYRFLRLIFILPVICLFILLPLSLSSFHLGGPTIFYLVWLANFKLLLYSFHLGPLSLPNNSSLPRFIILALLPIKLNLNVNSKNKERDPHLFRSVLLGVVKLLAFAAVLKIYEFRQHLPTFVLLLNYCAHLYLVVEVTLTVTAALVRPLLGMGLALAPQFNEPYLATSLQDFWGRRWNLMVSDILRLSVYDPIRRLASPMLGRRWALVAALLASFIVSGLMHEVIYFYFTRVKPTWEVTCFFLLHGVCTAIEVVVKEALNGRFRLHSLVSGPLTIAFVGITAWWLFLPQVLRNGVDVKVIQEYPLMFAFIKDKVSSFLN